MSNDKSSDQPMPAAPPATQAANTPFAARGSAVEIEQGMAFAPKFDGQGLIPAIVTDARSGDVVMFAWMNAQALQKTIETGWATFWSRSRGGLWVKGETSSNRQKVVELRTDCDQDAVWLKVEVEGHGASCHTGHVSCFYRAVPVGQPISAATLLQQRDAGPAFDAANVYPKNT
jgi:phosphoribosyl-AMP cyclohydrolase